MKLFKADTRNWTVMELTDQHRHVLRHTLTGSSSTGDVYRNYFAAAPGHHDWQALTDLVMAGLMFVGDQVPGAGSRYFYCTAAGARAVGLHIPPERRLPLHAA